ncbi:NAD(P)-dependent oxidoreductase [Acidihalobacter prosperus]
MTEISEKTIGFLGLGQMGIGMASRLIENDHSLIVYNRSQEKMQPLADKGAKAASQPSETAVSGGIIISMLADDNAVEALIDDNLLSKLGPGSIHLSMSTLNPAVVSRLAEQHARHGVDYIACPVFGRPDAARAGKLWLCLAGGSASSRSRIEPLLDTMGQGVYEFGSDPVSANVVKLSGNFLIASAIESMSEAYSLAEAYEINPEKLHELMSQTLFACPIYKNYGQAIVDQKFTPPGFTLELGAKDMRLVQDTARQTHTPMPFASLLNDRFLRMLANDQGKMDWTGISADQRDAAGLTRK